MKKSKLLIGAGYVLFGALFLVMALVSETKLDGILFGFAGAGIGPGVAMIIQYFYWNAPERKTRYEERVLNAQIEEHDELIIKVRNEAGRRAFMLGIFVTCAAILAFTVLGALDVVKNVRIIIFYLGGYLLFQEIAGIVIFKKLMRKY